MPTNTGWINSSWNWLRLLLFFFFNMQRGLPHSLSNLPLAIKSKGCYSLCIFVSKIPAGNQLKIEEAQHLRAAGGGRRQHHRVGVWGGDVQCKRAELPEMSPPNPHWHPAFHFASRIAFQRFNWSWVRCKLPTQGRTLTFFVPGSQFAPLLPGCHGHRRI